MKTKSVSAILGKTVTILVFAVAGIFLSSSVAWQFQHRRDVNDQKKIEAESDNLQKTNQNPTVKESKIELRELKSFGRREPLEPLSRIKKPAKPYDPDNGIEEKKETKTKRDPAALKMLRRTPF